MSHWASKIKRVGKYANGFEAEVAANLKSRGVKAEYEPEQIPYTKPAKACKYTPQFVLGSGLVVQTIGLFTTADRQKHILIRKQQPLLDIRFVFVNSARKISKKSAVSYAQWCERYGFKYADKSIPKVWLAEKLSPESKAAAEALPVKVGKRK
jgi:hypothetical protein